MGKLIDADICLNKAWQNFHKQEDEHEKNIDDYDILRDRFYEQSGFECCQQTIVNEQPVEAIPIPKGATNGDMMIAIYGIVDAEVNERSVRLFPKDGGQLWVTKDWWNAEFKEPIKALEQEPTTKNDLGVDCISRDDVRDVMQELWGTSGELMDRLMALPPVTPQEPRKGRWIRVAGGSLIDDYRCDCCNHQPPIQKVGSTWGWDFTDYCPSCGCRMVEPHESGVEE